MRGAARKRPRTRRRGPRRLGVFLVGLFAGALAIGFVVFASRIDAAQPPDPMPRADGIVVWTGGGGRLETAGQLLEDGHGERLLVSGVNPDIDTARVAELSGVSADQRECCLDLDYAALDTRGNAVETATWASALGYEHIILVTSAYHMPRARVELGHASAGLRVTAVPVRATDARSWWRDGDRARRLLGEYGKFLLSLARGRNSTRDALPEVEAPPPRD